MTGRLRTGGAWMLLALVGTSAPSDVRAQDSTGVVDALLRESRRALEDLNYRGADSIAQTALGLPRLRRAQRIQALQLSAAASFPSSTADQHPEAAVASLRSLIRFAPNAAPSAAISWRGLDSLFVQVRQTTFGMGVSLHDSVQIEGFQGFVPIDVMTTRPARVRLLLTPRIGSTTPVVVDSTGPVTAATLRIQPVMAEQPRFPSGDYVGVVEATSEETGERLSTNIVIVLSTPPQPLHRVPMTWDRAGIRRTRTRPARATSVVSGLLIGAFTALGVKAHRPAELVRETGADGRAAGWGFGLGLLTTIGSWALDHGREISENIKFNDGLQREWSATQTRLLEENRAWQVSYRGWATTRLEDN